MSLAASTIRRARARAGITQSELAHRLGTTQSAVARLERPGSNPTMSTLTDALWATGHRLELRPVRQRAQIDEAQLQARLDMTPRQRLDAFTTSQANLIALREGATRVDPD